MKKNREITGGPLHICVVLAALFAAGCKQESTEVFEGRPGGSIRKSPGSEWERIDNPGEDGWGTEVLTAKISGQLKKLGALISGEEKESPEAFAAIAAATFSCGSLRPGDLELVFKEPPLEIRRRRAGAGSPNSLPAYRAPRGLARAIESFSLEWKNRPGVRASFKVYGVTEKNGTIETTQHLAIFARGSEGLVEEHSAWTTRWEKAGEEEEPLLSSIAVDHFEQIRNSSEAPLFTDRTEAVLGSNPSFRRQLQLGLNHWLNRSQDNRFFALLGTPGLALGDVNGDGLDDLYVCQEGGLPNLLFLRNPDGTAADSSAVSGANWLESSRAALLVDLDNDGHQDLAVTVLGALILAAGNGSGGFEIRASIPTSNDTMSLSAADVDLDGDLDLYVCSHKADDLSQDAGVVSIGAADGFVYHDANNAAANLLLRNDIAPTGSWTFTDITVKSGLDVNNRRFSFAAAWEDYDNDGDPDLYVANDFGRNNLYRNDISPGAEPRFVDVAASEGAEDSASGMSVSWSDYDRDGLMDLYVSNMFSAAGSRVTRQDSFKPKASEQVRKRLQRFARGNTLLRRGGNGFEDVSLSARVNMGRWAWGSSFVDLNGDGWDDLIVANGYITTNDTGDL